MELDDLRFALQSLDRRLSAQDTDLQALLTAARRRPARASLRPLACGQVVLIAAAVPLVLVAGSFWYDHRAVPHLLVVGLLLHAYGIAAIAVAARTLVLIHRIEVAAPVLEIQRRLADLRRWYIRSGLALALPWWWLWLPLALLAARRAGLDLVVHASAWVVASAAVGIVGMLATWQLYCWALRPDPQHPTARRIADSAPGRSLRRAQAAVDELIAFERP